MKLVGLCGVAGSGKNTLADEMTKNLGYEQRALAEPIRRSLYALNPDVVKSDGTIERVQEIVDSIGWDEAKRKHTEIRELLQKFGTEAGRDVHGENVWVDALFNNFHGEKLVVTDVRFPNEAKAIQDRGGIIVRITREGYTPINAHVSEIAYTDQDYILVNEGTPEDLYKKFLEKVIVPLEFN